MKINKAITINKIKIRSFQFPKCQIRPQTKRFKKTIYQPNNSQLFQHLKCIEAYLKQIRLDIPKKLLTHKDIQEKIQQIFMFTFFLLNILFKLLKKYNLMSKLIIMRSITDRICCEPLPFFPNPYYFEFQEGKVKDLSSFQGNQIKTSKYNFLNFLPKAIYSQYRRIANFYFLLLAIIAIIPVLSIPDPQIIWIILILILSVSLIKQLYEDIGRHKIDEEINEKRISKIWTSGQEKFVQWRQIKVGDIVQINEGQVMPADLLLLSSSDSEGVAYIQTSNLDGEQAAKVRYAFKQTNNYSASELSLAKGSFQGQQPSPSFTDFRANLTFFEANLAIIDCGQLLFRGSKLKSTPKIYGIVIYTGQCSKIMLNGQQFTSKLSSLEGKLNIFLFIMFGIQLIACLTAAGIGANWQQKNRSSHSYIGWKNDFSWGSAFIINFLIFFIDTRDWIPISLIISIEFAKAFVGYYISSDQLMFSKWRGKKARTNTAALCEQLGQIDYLFCDKTGTLTKNKLSFSKAMIDSRPYSFNQSTVNQQYQSQLFSRDLESQRKVDFFKTQMLEFGPVTKCPIQRYLLCLLVCNSVTAVQSNGKLAYEGQSPDELTLVSMAASFGFKLLKRDRTGINVQIFGQQLRIGIPVIFPFTSQRKRMSVIIQICNSYILLAKGADSQIISRTFQRHQGLQFQLSNLARQGLRTLLFAGRSIKRQDVDRFLLKQKRSQLSDRQKNLVEASLYFESQLSILGASALLDQLQQGVAETLKDMLSAGIRSWMLTGDKLQTAVEVGKNCGLISSDSKLVYLKKNWEGLSLAQQDISSHQGPASLIIEGQVLGQFCSNQTLQINLARLTLSFSSVICCRMLPSQKSKAVSMVRKHLRKICLAVGDGCNDVSMIKQADVGVGLYGEEGMAAVQASDYAIPEFRMLWRLILVHGRWNYLRISRLVLYVAFKSVLFTVPRYIHIFYNGYSSQSIYDNIHSGLYNTVFTAFPVVFSAMFSQDINYLVKQQVKIQSQPMIPQSSQQVLKGYKINMRIKKQFPIRYRIGPQNNQFNAISCIKCVAEGVIISSMAYWFVGLSIGGVSAQQNGRNSNLQIEGVVLHSMIVLMATAKLVIIEVYWTIPLLLSLIFSITVYVGFIWLTDYLIISRHSQGSVLPSFQVPQAYLVFIYLISILLMINNLPKIECGQQTKQIYSSNNQLMSIKKEGINDVISSHKRTSEEHIMSYVQTVKVEIERNQQQ